MSSQSNSSFVTKLGWTVLVGLVFGIGLVTGQRLLDFGDQPPLVSVEASQADRSAPDNSDETASESETSGNHETAKPGRSSTSGDTLFSFYERLSGGSEGPKQPRTDQRGSADAGREAAKYTLQLSAYPDRKRARNRMRRFEKMGLDPYLVAADLPDRGTYYRIRIGKFTSMDDAKTFKRELERKRGVESVVTPL